MLDVEENIYNLHLAVMHRAPLLHLLRGEKRIESRFSRNKVIPHERVHSGDRILFKEVSGPIRATAIAGSVATWKLKGPEDVAMLPRLYNGWIRADEHFWAWKQDSRWATLIHLVDIEAWDPFAIEKRNRCPWVILDSEKLASYNNIQLEEALSLL